MAGKNIDTVVDELLAEQEQYNPGAIPWEMVKEAREVVNELTDEYEPEWLTRRNAIDRGRENGLIIRDSP